jgi:hypothetical protein
MAAVESLDDEVSQQNETIEIIVNRESFTVDRSVAKASIFIDDTLNFSRETKIEITLSEKITNPKKIMGYIIEYITYHSKNPVVPFQTPIVSDNLLESGVSVWDNDFISKSDEEIVHLSMAANYLNIPDLLKLSCAKIGAIMKSVVRKHNTKQEQIEAVRQRFAVKA